MPEHGFVATQPQRPANAKDLNFENVLRLGFATTALRLRCGPKEFVLIRVHSWLKNIFTAKPAARSICAGGLKKRQGLAGRFTGAGG